MNNSGTLRVLMVALSCHPTEIAQMAGLRERGVDLRAVVGPESPHIDEIANRGVPVEAIALRSHFDRAGVRRLRQRIREERFDVVHGLANRPISNLFWASLGSPVKLVAYRGAIGHVNRWDPGAWLKWYNPRIDHIVCVSEAVRKDLLRSGIRSDRLTTIYKGHELGWYENMSEVDLGEFGIPQGAFVVGCAASMRPVKGADLLVRAMSRATRDSDVHCLLIGEVRDARISRLIDDLGLEDRVHLAGYRSDAAAIIGACDVVVAPSRGREGLTKSVIEAMAQGRPAIVSTAGGLPEMVDDGRSGYVIPIDDVDALADRIRRLAADPEAARAMGCRARSVVADRFSAEHTVERTLALYRELLAR